MSVPFDAYKYRFASHRNVVYARGGMVCTTSPVASQVGLDILKKGGNAMDAALAVATTLPLTEPTSNGLGSDCFVIAWMDGKLYGLNGSGVAPKALSADIVRAAGHSVVPMSGWLPTMVPGAPASWAMLRKRFGTMEMKDIMAPAIRYAREGYNVPVNPARLWVADTKRFTEAAETAPETFAPWLEMFTKDGKPYEAGDIFRSEDYARTLESLAATDCESYYHGEIMEKIVAFSQKTGGYFSREDFENYKPMWVEPITTKYRGYDVYELPPNGHGITVLMALNILSGMKLDGDRNSDDTWHKIMEAIKLAFVDTKKYVADPRTMKTTVEQLLSLDYAAKRRALITENAILPEAGDPACGGTVYFAVADGKGNMVSFIQSNYKNFGSGIVIPGTGISLQNRGANFSLDPASDNYLEGGKRSYHTIIPGFLGKDGKAIGPFGVMGGFMQPQGHVQVLVNMLDYGMNPQEALDCPRCQWVGDKNIQLESDIPLQTVEALKARGHDVEVLQNTITMGRGQIIWRREDGTYIGATEPRADGCIASY